jgi:signal recognition particle subunit SRP54
MASLDVYRPAAQEQLAVLGRDLSIETLPIVAGQQPVQIAQRALQAGKLGGYDIVLLDTAGRTTLDEEMMTEAAEVKAAAKPHEILLVADSLTGQDAVNLARAFDQRVGLTGIALTRVDGDGRGAALSMRAVTGKPIKLIGTGEKTDALEDFYPSRIAGRILGMGDVVSLVEKAAAHIDAEKAARVAEKMRKGKFDLVDLRDQLQQMQNMGGLGGLLGMMPGIAKMKNQIAAANLDDKVVKRQVALIDSMTREERKNPDVLKASRKKRIAAGAGLKVEELNKLLKMHRNMADMMKAMGQGKQRGPLAGMAQAMGFGGGGMPSAEAMKELAAKMPGGIPQGAPSLPKDFPNLPGTGLPGLENQPCRVSEAFRDWARRNSRNRFHAIQTHQRRNTCQSLSASRAQAPRSVRFITSSSPTRAFRAMAASSNASATSIRFCRRTVSCASSSTWKR